MTGGFVLHGASHFAQVFAGVADTADRVYRPARLP
jgi:hypothetical protein